MLYDTLALFDRLGRDLSSVIDGAVGAPVDISRDDDRYVIDVDLPGVDPRSVDVTVEGHWLIIRAERSSASRKEDAEWLVRERSTSRFVRRFSLGDGIDADSIEARYDDGVLSVVVPVAVDARRHKVPVSLDSAGQRALSSSTLDGVVDGEGKARSAHSPAS